MLTIMLMVVLLMIIYNIKILMITHVDLGIDDHSGSFIYLFWLAFYFHCPFFSLQWDDETGKVIRFCLKVNPAIKIQILIFILLSLCISYRSRGKKFSESTQQDARKKRMAKRLCVTNVTGLLLMCFVVIFT